MNQAWLQQLPERGRPDSASRQEIGALVGVTITGCIPGTQAICTISLHKEVPDETVKDWTLTEVKKNLDGFLSLDLQLQIIIAWLDLF